MAEQLDIVIEQGATFSYVFQVLNKDLTTGYTWAVQGRSQHAAASTVFASGTNATIAATKSGNHTHATVTMSYAQTAALTAPASGVYDIEYLETSSGIKTRAFEGSFYIVPEATK